MIRVFTKNGIWVLLCFAATFNRVTTNTEGIGNSFKGDSDRAALQQIADEMKELVQISDQRRKQELKEADERKEWATSEQDTMKAVSDGVKQVAKEISGLRSTADRTQEVEMAEKYSSEIKAMQQQVSILAKKTEELELQNQEAMKKMELLQHNFSETNQRLLELANATGKLWQEKEAHETNKNCTKARLMELTTASNGKKYYFSDTSKAGTWTDANDWCENRGLYLATLKNQIDLDAVHQKTKTLNVNYWWWWVSAKSEGNGEDPDYRWRDGSKVEENMWAADNYNAQGCVAIRTAKNSSLYSVRCNDNSNYFICELPIECY
ncbi:uncharacterized protein LOC132200775 [Neocloeon triangulifer]|uniref:uncharacterized protein LOC132200775 n=1 Tax=Neocloeon triangulifer TaxID=2078957 RepID=UPI00286EF13A|nr:uncharacterized protein LOC132200775 [Neocloeon triangulifer]